MFERLPLKFKFLIPNLLQGLITLAIIAGIFSFGVSKLNQILENQQHQRVIAQKFRHSLNLTNQLLREELNKSEFDRTFQTFIQELEATGQNQINISKLKEIKILASRGYKNIVANRRLLAKIMDLSNSSIEKSDGFIKTVMQKLADPEQEKSVSTLTRMVVIGANVNTNANFTIQVKTLQMKADLSKKDELIAFLDKAIANSKKSSLALKGTPYFHLVLSSDKSNTAIKGFALEFAKNTVESEEIFLEIENKVQGVLNTFEQEDITHLRAAFQEIKQFGLFAALLLVASSIFIFLIGFFVLKLITGPLNETLGILKNIAEGEGDLTLRLKSTSNDEIGELAKWFNLFMESLRETIREIQEMVDWVSTNSAELSASSDQILNTCEGMAEDTENSSSAINQNVVSIQLLSSALSSSSTEIQEISEIAEKSELAAAQASEALLQSNKSIQKIEESSTKIGGFVDVITDISNQTNLLSLNAAIEAAKAGEFGKGFSVVADEVRNLAERSNASVSEIKQLIDISSSNVREGNIIIERASAVLMEVITNTNKMTEPIKQVSDSIQEQEIGVQEMEKATEEILLGSENNASAVVELTETVKESSKVIQNLSQKAENLNNKYFGSEYRLATSSSCSSWFTEIAKLSPIFPAYNRSPHH